MCYSRLFLYLHLARWFEVTVTIKRDVQRKSVEESSRSRHGCREHSAWSTDAGSIGMGSTDRCREHGHGEDGCGENGCGEHGCPVHRCGEHGRVTHGCGEHGCWEHRSWRAYVYLLCSDRCCRACTLCSDGSEPQCLFLKKKKNSFFKDSTSVFLVAPFSRYYFKPAFPEKS